MSADAVRPDYLFEGLKILVSNGALAMVGIWLTSRFTRARERERQMAEDQRAKALESERQKSADARARAEQRMRSNREISEALSGQLIFLHRVKDMVAAVQEGRLADRDKGKARLAEMFGEMAQLHWASAPIVVRNSPFLSDAVGQSLRGYQQVVGQFTRVIGSSYGKAVDAIRGEELANLIQAIATSFTQFQIAIREEFHSDPNTPSMIPSPPPTPTDQPTLKAA